MFQDGSAREAVERYVDAVPNSEISEVVGEDGPGQTIRFTLARRPFIAFESPVRHDFAFTPAMSVFVTCDTDEEVDRSFASLGEGGDVFMPPDDYGFSRHFVWFSDRYGVSWQVGSA